MECPFPAARWARREEEEEELPSLDISSRLDDDGEEEEEIDWRSGLEVEARERTYC